MESCCDDHPSLRHFERRAGLPLAFGPSISTACPKLACSTLLAQNLANPPACPSPTGPPPGLICPLPPTPRSTPPSSTALGPCSARHDQPNGCSTRCGSRSPSQPIRQSMPHQGRSSPPAKARDDLPIDIVVHLPRAAGRNKLFWPTVSTQDRPECMTNCWRFRRPEGAVAAITERAMRGESRLQIKFRRCASASRC